MPYTEGVEGASLTYKMAIPENVSEVNVHVVVKSTLAFHDVKGHEYAVGFEGGKETVVNFNANLNEEPENVYNVFYPTVARRVVEKGCETCRSSICGRDAVAYLETFRSGNCIRENSSGLRRIPKELSLYG